MIDQPLAELVVEHAKVVAVCGGGDHEVERCSSCGSAGEVHAYDWSEHVESVLREALDQQRRRLVELLKVETFDVDVETYHARVLNEVGWVFDDMGASAV